MLEARAENSTTHLQQRMLISDWIGYTKCIAHAKCVQRVTDRQQSRAQAVVG